jgi:hypothetical protein
MELNPRFHSTAESCSRVSFDETSKPAPRTDAVQDDVA